MSPRNLTATIPHLFAVFIGLTLAGCDPPLDSAGAGTLDDESSDSSSDNDGDPDFRDFVLVAKLLTAKDVSGDECGSSAVCQCKSWGGAGGGGYQYGVCSVSCTTNYGVGNPATACPAQTPSCIQGNINSICAFHP